MTFINLFENKDVASVSMKERQKPLTEQYMKNAESATVLDFAETSSDWSDITNPLATIVKIDKSEELTKVGVHQAVGGDSDNPTPGDILCGALASCLDSTIRVISNRFGLQLRHLKIQVIGKVDVRGTLRVDRTVPVAFTEFDVIIDIKAKGLVPSKYLDKLIEGAEQSCIVMQTLKPACEIRLTRK